MTALNGADAVVRELRDMAERSGDLRPLWDTISRQVWQPRQQAVFTAGKLAPLSPRSVRRKRVHKTEPMIDTGALREATYHYSPIKSTADRASYGIPKGGRRKAIGAMHAVKSGSRPKRDVVPNWTKAERERILDIFAEFIMEGR